MMHRYFALYSRFMGVLLGLSLLWGFMTSLSPYASAASVASTSKHCVATLVHLLGKNKADIKCMKEDGSAITPHTSRINCYSSGVELDILSNANGEVCFTGHGYLGFRLDYVFYLASSGSSGYVRYYPEGSTNGNFFYFNSGTYCNNGSTANCPGDPFKGNVGITQIGID